MNPVFTITNGITANLTRIERARGFFEAAVLSEEWLSEMRQRALVSEAHHTTHIEGTRLTLEQSARLLSGLPSPDADPDDVRELLNYRTAMGLVAEYLDDGSPVTEVLIREIHRRLVDGVRGGAASPGAYRAVQNYVANGLTGEVVYMPLPPHDVPVLMRGLVDWLNGAKEVHPALVAGIAQFQLVHIHPFMDGNGRTSRLLSTLCLYRTGYDFKRLFTISEYYDRNRAAFYGAIQGVRDSGMDMTGWLEYFTSGLATQLLEVQERGACAISNAGQTRRHGLSGRQSRILSFASARAAFTIQDVEAACPDVNRRTLQRDLKALADKGLLSAEGSARGTFYRSGAATR